MKRCLFLFVLLLTLGLGATVAPAADKGTVVVVGGGQSGRPLAQILVEQGYTVRVMMRTPDRASGLPAEATVVQGDVTKPDSLGAGLSGANFVISTIGAPCFRDRDPDPGSFPEDVDNQGIAILSKAALSAGVSQLVLMSAIGAGNSDPNDGLNKMCNMVLDAKGKGEAALRESGLAYTIVRPGGLKPFPGQPDCSEGIEPLLMYPGNEDAGGGALCRGDVGLVMADALGNPDALGKTINLVGDKKSELSAWRSAWAKMPAD